MKRLIVALCTLICLAAGAARWVDLVNFTDLDTGFFTVGSHHLRYGVLAAVLVVLALCSLAAPKTSKSLEGCCPAQGWLALVSGVLFAALGGLELVNGMGDRLQMLLGVLCLATGVWLLLLGRSRFTPEFEAPTANALWGIAGTLSLLLFTIQRFGLAPTGVARIEPNIQGMAALLCLLFCTAQLRLAYVPDGKSAKTTWFLGMSSFLFAACLALPGRVCAFMVGQGDFLSLLEAVALAAVGCMGLVYSGSILLAKPQPEPEDVQTQQQAL